MPQQGQTLPKGFTPDEGAQLPSGFVADDPDKGTPSLYEQGRQSYEAKSGNVGMPGVSEGSGLREGLGEWTTRSFGDMGRGLKDFWGGKLARGTHEWLSGVGNLMVPAAALTAPAAPVMTARALAGGTAGGYLGKIGGEIVGLSPDQADLAGDIGGIAGGAIATMGAPRMRMSSEKAPVSPFAGMTSTEKPVGSAALPRMGASSSARSSTAPVQPVFVEGFDKPSIMGRIVHPESEPPLMKTTFQSYPREALVKLIRDPGTPYQTRVLALRELRRNPGNINIADIPNVRFLEEPGAKALPFRNLKTSGEPEPIIVQPTSARMRGFETLKTANPPTANALGRISSNIERMTTPEPQPVNPRELTDVEAQLGRGRVVTEERLPGIRRRLAAEKNVSEGLRGNRRDVAGEIREKHRAKLERQAP